MYMSENKIALRQSYFLYEFFLHNSTISSSIIGSPNLSVISLIIRNFSHISSDVIGYIVGIDQKLVKRTNSSANNFECSVFIEPSCTLFYQFLIHGDQLLIAFQSIFLKKQELPMSCMDAILS